LFLTSSFRNGHSSESWHQNLMPLLVTLTTALIL
jgi:hypothetical protein